MTEQEIKDLKKENEQLSMENFLLNATVHSAMKIDQSDFFMALLTYGATKSAKYAVELGFSILLNKPIIIVACDGVPVPPQLERVASKVIHAKNPIEAMDKFNEFYQSPDADALIKQFEQSPGEVH